MKTQDATHRAGVHAAGASGGDGADRPNHLPNPKRRFIRDQTGDESSHTDIHNPHHP